jgi:hypothetical protein
MAIGGGGFVYVTLTRFYRASSDFQAKGTWVMTWQVHRQLAQDEEETGDEKPKIP